MTLSTTASSTSRLGAIKKVAQREEVRPQNAGVANVAVDACGDQPGLALRQSHPERLAQRHLASDARQQTNGGYRDSPPLGLEFASWGHYRALPDGLVLV